MKRGIFRRYFVIYAVTLAVCTLLLGIILLHFLFQSFGEERENSLLSSARQGVAAVQYSMDRSGGATVIRSEVESVFSMIAGATGNEVFFCDYNGRVLLCCEGNRCTHTAAVIPQQVLFASQAHGQYSDIGYLGGFFTDEGRYAVILPVVSGNSCMGYVIAASPINNLFSFLLRIVLMYLGASIVMLAGSTVIIYYSTKTLTHPLQEMSEIAAEFGSGDFSRRITVKGNDEVARLGRVLNEMADSLCELEDTRRSFVANVSHELRTPMTTIGGYIDGILDGTIPLDQQRRYLNIALEEVKRLARLSSSLLDIARMEAGAKKAAVSKKNIWDIILSVMLAAERRITGKNIRVGELNVMPVFALCDGDMLHQVVYNLIDNAIKFTPEGGLLSVSVSEEGGRVLARIRNSGEGIAPEDLPHIFDRFYKTDRSRGLDKTGTGLGLYIVRTLVDRMDGEISCTSQVGEYTEFTVSLLSVPAEKPQKKRRSDAKVRRYEKQKKPAEQPPEKKSEKLTLAEWLDKLKDSTEKEAARILAKWKDRGKKDGS